MIVTSDIEATVESNFEGERHKMGFDEDALPHLMAILSGQYSDPGLAVVREYSTNAIDAQVDEGWIRPIEVTSPTWSSSIFSVQDWGCGMNADDIRRVYRFYGASTKRNSDDYNGTMGIGSKSAFAYTNQFTVDSNKNGIKTVVVVSRDEDGGGDMTIISKSPTDQPNGTTISVPVIEANSFNYGIQSFFKHLAPGLALVDGQDISEWGTYTKVMGEVKNDKGETVINGIYHVPRTGYRYVAEDRVYMGGVSYPALRDLSEVRTDPPMDIMVDVPIGAVRFSPSRESLMDTKRTKATLELAGKVYAKHLAKSVRADIAASKSILEAVTVFQRNRSLLSDAEAKDITYDGVVLADNVAAFNITVDFSTKRYNQYIEWTAFDVNGDETSGRTASSGCRIDPRAMHTEQPLFIKGYTSDRVPAHNKKRLQYYAKNHYTAPSTYTKPDGLPVKIYLFSEVPKQISDHPILSTIDWVDWADIAAVKMPRAPHTAAARPRFAGRRLVLQATSADWELEDVASLNAKHIHYTIGGAIKRSMSGTAFSRDNGGAEWAFLRAASEYVANQADGTILVNVYANSEKKFLAEFPKAVKVDSLEAMRKPVFDRMLAEFAKDLEDNATHAAHSQSATCRVLHRLTNMLGVDCVDDPSLQRLAKFYGGNNYTGDTYRFHASREHFDKATKMLNEAAAKARAEINEVETCYPILSVVHLDASRTEGARAVADYLNAIYNNSNKENE